MQEFLGDFAKTTESDELARWLNNVEGVYRQLTDLDPTALRLFNPDKTREIEGGKLGPAVLGRKEQVFFEFVSKVFADDVVDQAEVERLGLVGRAFYGSAEAGAAVWWPRFGLAYTAARLGNGLQPLDRPTVLLHEGEQQYFDGAATVIEEKQASMMVGGSPAITIPLGGVRIRLGGFAAAPVALPTKITAVDSGRLAVTSARLVYMGANRTLEIPMGKLVALNLFSDGLAIHATGRAAPLTLRVESPNLVAAVVARASEPARS